ncbi:hypothetical protein KHB02_003640 [Bacillus sp. FJAT-50051]|uniref:Uncharacterized protein n=1 Tax=Neobacillus citreus TaxID=2833578 RepID=A0A9J6MXV6_9BACI|nr:hypothetical protein [Neobacillus citreus]
MNASKPSFIDTPYFYYDDNVNMRLKDGAPSEVRREFNRFIKAYSDWQRMNVLGLETPPPVYLDEIEDERGI